MRVDDEADAFARLHELARVSAAAVRWPYRCAAYSQQHGGYVVWRDVFEGAMACTLADAIDAHRAATFVAELDALEYCVHRNRATVRYGTDAVTAIPHPLLTAAEVRERVVQRSPRGGR